MTKLIFSCFICLLFFACEETGSSSSIAKAPDQSSSPPIVSDSTAIQKSVDEQTELLGKTLDFEEFNEKVKAAHQGKEEWVSSPLSVTLKFTGADMDSNIKSVRSRKLGPGESIQDVIVTVEEEGLMDDSVSGSITMVRMKKEEDVWQIYKATRAWKCWKGRGHETYSGEPCG